MNGIEGNAVVADEPRAGGEGQLAQGLAGDWILSSY